MHSTLDRILDRLFAYSLFDRLPCSVQEQQQAINQYTQAYPIALAEAEARSKTATEPSSYCPFTLMDTEEFHERFVKPSDLEKELKQFYANFPKNHTVEDDVKRIHDYLIWLQLYVACMDEGQSLYWVYLYSDYYEEFGQLRPHLLDTLPTPTEIESFEFPEWVHNSEIHIDTNYFFHPEFPYLIPAFTQEHWRRVVRATSSPVEVTSEPVEVTWLDEDPFEACEIPF